MVSVVCSVVVVVLVEVRGGRPGGGVGSPVDIRVEELGEGVVVIASSANDKVNLIAMVTDDVMKKGAHAGNLIKGIAALVGGGGGGRPNMAQAGGKNPAGIPDAIAKAVEVLEVQL